MAATEETITKLERRFPSLSGKVFASAREEVLALGLSVLTAEGGVIYRVFPDGRRELVKKITAPTKAERGLKLKIR